MLKKILPLTTILCAATLSGQVFAGNFAGPGATTVSPATGATNYCESLSNDVKIQLSKDVFAGYTCPSASSFNVAVCHATGTNKSQTVSCTYTAVDIDATPVVYTKSDDQCPDYDSTAGAVQATNVTFDGRVAFQGASGGGTVSSVNLRGTTCDGATVEALTN